MRALATNAIYAALSSMVLTQVPVFNVSSLSTINRVVNINIGSESPVVSGIKPITNEGQYKNIVEFLVDIANETVFTSVLGEPKLLELAELLKKLFKITTIVNYDCGSLNSVRFILPHVEQPITTGGTIFYNNNDVINKIIDKLSGDLYL